MIYGTLGMFSIAIFIHFRHHLSTKNAILATAKPIHPTEQQAMEEEEAVAPFIGGSGCVIAG